MRLSVSLSFLIMILLYFGCSNQCDKASCDRSCRRAGYPNGGFCFEGDCHCYESIRIDHRRDGGVKDYTVGDEEGGYDRDGVIDELAQDGGVKDSSIEDSTVVEDRQQADTQVDGEDGEQQIDYGDLCRYCSSHDDCGGPNDYCLRNSQNGEIFCGKDCSNEPCPPEFTCFEIPTQTGFVYQCVPEDGTCSDFPLECDPPCEEGEECRQGRCVGIGEWEEELQHCVDVINSYRELEGLPPLTRDPVIEAYAMEGARYDAEHYQSCGPHCHFRVTNGGGVAIAENEIPGWPLDWYGSVNAVIEQGTEAMYNEGPGGGHHDNLVNPNFTRVGCGIYVTPSNEVWVVQDFR